MCGMKRGGSETSIGIDPHDASPSNDQPILNRDEGLRGVLISMDRQGAKRPA